MPARRAWLTSMASQSARMLDGFSGQELACVAWAMSRMAQEGGHAALLVSPPAARPGAAAAVVTAVKVSAVGRGAARSGGLPPDASAEVAAAAAGAVGGTPDGHGGASATIVHAEISGNGSFHAAAPGPSCSSSSAAAPWMQRVLMAALQRLHAGDLGAQGVTCVLLSAARLQHQPSDAVLRQLCLHAQTLLLGGGGGYLPSRPQQQEQQQGNDDRTNDANSPIATTHLMGGSHIDAGAGTITHISSGGSGSGSTSWAVEPQAVSNLLLALARMHYRPPAACMAAFEAAAARCMCSTLQRRRRRQLHSGLSSSPAPLTAASQHAPLNGPSSSSPSPTSAWTTPVSHSPTVRSQHLAAAVSTQLLAAPQHLLTAPSLQLLPEHLGSILWAMARLGWTPSPEFVQLHLLCTASLAPGFSSTRMAQVLAALTHMRVRVGRQWLELACGQVRHRVWDGAG